MNLHPSTHDVEVIRFALRKLHYFFRAYASSMERGKHLEYFYETESQKDRTLFDTLMKEYLELNSMLFRFISSVDKEHNTDIFTSSI